MFINRILALLIGYLNIRFRGERVERFINLCLQRGIQVWDVYTTRNGTVVGKTNIDGFRQMRPVARRSKVSVRIISRRGLPFLCAKLWKRTAFAAGAILFFVSLHILGAMIWFVDVDGVDKVPASRVIEAAAELGLKPGRFRESLVASEMSRALCIKVPELSWAGIELTGTKALIKVVEKKIVTADPRPVGHVLASKNGSISKIVATTGKSMARAGDNVQQGQILISGAFQVDEEAEIRYVHAEGIVEARIQYAATAESSMRRMVRRRTGESVQCEELEVDGTVIMIKGPKAPPYGLSEEQVKPLPLLWRSLGAPVEHRIRNIYELVEQFEQVSFEQAKQEALDAALQQANQKLPPGVKVDKHIVQVELLPDQNTVQVTVIVETIEPIGVFSPIVEHPSH